MWRLVAILIISAALATSGGCRTVWQARFATPRQYHHLDVHAPFLKCHHRDGSVSVLTSWSIDRRAAQIRGNGVLYDDRRQLVRRGELRAPFEDVLLVESNQPKRLVDTGELLVLGVVSAASLAATAACIANPKACFGSCPTFYADDGTSMILQAEGFSDSIAPFLEATDVDALYLSRSHKRRFRVLMTNEAVETHAVRSVRLLAARRPLGTERVLRADRRYFSVRSFARPTSCKSALGDCRAAVASFDGHEHSAPTDPEDLAAQETVELVFAAAPGRSGLAIGARNSLVNTFLFYQTLAHMGSLAGDWLMKLERGDSRLVEATKALGRLVARIDVSVFDGRDWQAVGSVAEAGPIARDVHLLLLPSRLPQGPLRVRLSMARGYWKLDYLALAALGPQVEPIALSVRRVTQDGRPRPDALDRLLDEQRHLLTFPNDAYALDFLLPADPALYDLFLESRGYYIEWMRHSWLDEEDQDAALSIFADPQRALRRLAPRYKRLEPSMEQVFWQTRLGARGAR